MRILVVCGAGASSTFVAQRLRTAAAAAGLDWDADAGVESTVSLGGHDLVLVGPHLRERPGAIRPLTRAPGAVRGLTRAPVAVLPDDVFADRDGGRTLLLAQSTLAAAGGAPKGTP